MNQPRNVVLVAAGALALSTLSAAPALAGDGANVLRASLVGSNPAPASPVIAGINPGGLPWVIGDSPVRVRYNGRIDVRIRGLVIPVPPFAGTNPVASVVAALVCDRMVVDSTDPFALDTAGNGRTGGKIMVPKDCDDPVVLIQPAANRNVYIASAMD